MKAAIAARSRSGSSRLGSKNLAYSHRPDGERALGGTFGEGMGQAAWFLRADRGWNSVLRLLQPPSRLPSDAYSRVLMEPSQSWHAPSSLPEFVMQAVRYQALMDLLGAAGKQSLGFRFSRVILDMLIYRCRFMRVWNRQVSTQGTAPSWICNAGQLLSSAAAWIRQTQLALEALGGLSSRASRF